MHTFSRRKIESVRNTVSLFKGMQSIAGNTGCIQAEKLAFCKLMQISLINIKLILCPPCQLRFKGKLGEIFIFGEQMSC